MTGFDFYADKFLHDEESCFNLDNCDSLMSYSSLLFEPS